MLSTNHVNFAKISSLLLALFVAILPCLVHGDDLTGQAQDDPKDLQPAQEIAPPPIQQTGTILFLPMPGWARETDMSSMPGQLKPLGKKAPVAVAPAPTPAPLAPPPEAPAVASTPTKTVQPKTAPIPAETPALVAVSPFLEWIKANPQAAAAEARQQANSYHAPTPFDASPSNGPGNAGGAANGATGNTENPYWLPPLIDSANFGSGAVGGSSAAIYSTPQR